MNTAMTKDEIISVLNELIETCKNGEHGFQTAAEGVRSDNLKSSFYEFSKQRAEFGVQLKDEVKSLGGDPEQSGTILGALHRGWIDLKSAISQNNESAVLAECERGEDYAVQAYEDALQKELPAQLRSVVQNQYNTVKTTHDKVRNLERVSSASM